MNEDDLLNEQLANPSERRTNIKPPNGRDDGPEQAVQGQRASVIEFRQWQIGPNDTFRPAGLTREALLPGVYRFGYDNVGLYVQKINIITDELVELPDSANERVLKGMKTFWERRHIYAQYGLLYKRGVLLWGPPGGGKTATLTLLMKQLIDDGGVVVLCEYPPGCAAGLAALRRIEPDRPLICVMEDIDEIIQKHGEHDLLALLDGENQVDNIVQVASTNYPEVLGARIVNRPSRFDERIYVGMPTAAARRVYLSRPSLKIGDDIERWVKDTDGLSIAHLRELAAAVLCLGQPYKDVLSRLRAMKYKIKEGTDVGFGN